MGAYILRRLLLMIPTLLGIMAISFAVIQFAPGGPVEQVIANLQGQGSNGADRIGGGASDFGGQGSTDSGYRGAQGLDPAFIKKLEVQFGFDKPPLERFGKMIWDYSRFQFGESYFRSVSVLDLIIEKMPVSISLGLWITLLSYGISIPLGIRKALKDGSTFDVWTSGVIIVAYAIPGFLFAILLIVLFAGGSFYDLFPLRGLTSENWSELSWPARIADYFWHLTLPLIALSLSAFATTTLLTKNSFLDEIRKQYVTTARAKGLTENKVLYGHVFRNAMLIIVAGFPGAFISAFFAGSLLIETIFSLDGLGLLGFESIYKRDYPVVFATLYIFSLIGLVTALISDLTYTWIDPRIDFENGRSEMDTTRENLTETGSAIPAAVEAREDANTDTAGIAQMAPGAQVARSRLSPLNARRLQSFKANRRGVWSFWIFLFLFVATLGAEFVANDKPLLIEYKGEYYAPIFVDYPEEVFGGFLPVTNYRDPFVQEEITANGWMVWPPIRYSYRTVNNEIPTPAPSAPSWTFTKEERCARYPQGVNDPNCVLGNTNWLGTDDQARDVAARLIYGFRISVLFGLILTGLSAVIGVSAGAVQGYFGGWVDLLFQRFIEIWSSIPVLYLLLIIAAILPPGFWILLGIMLLFSWVSFVGVVRAEFLRARNFEYVNAARALGVGDWTIMVRHLLPNAMVATLTFLPFILNGSITTLTSLDFLGFGLPPGSPSLGELLAQGKNNLQAPWLGISGFVVLSLMLSLLVFVGEAVRDAFDPRKSFR